MIKNMTTKSDVIAFDRASARSIDLDGRMIVKGTHISKACVNPYFGREIPDSDKLGLDKDKVYYLYRDPEELKKGAETFNNVQLLYRHVKVDSDDPQKDEIIGSVGNARFEDPYLDADVMVWDKKGIVAIDSKELAQLSCSYHYRADMTPGIAPDGTKFDGVMRDIHGNHVAIVKRGRAGPDVVVADEQPAELTMRCKKIIDSIKAFLPEGVDVLALDAALAAFPGALDEAEKPEDKPEDKPGDKSGDKSAKDKKAAKDKKPAKDKKGAKDADEDDEDEDEDDDEDEDSAEDSFNELVEKLMKRGYSKESATKIAGKVAAEKGDDSKKAHDELIEALAVAEAHGRKVAEDAALAREEVKSIVGTVALDEAPAIYKLALDKLEVDTTDIHPSAYRALVKNAIKTGVTAPSTQIASDSAMESTFTSMSRIKVLG